MAVSRGRTSEARYGIAVAADPPPTLEWLLEVWRAPDDGLGAPLLLEDEIVGRGVPGDSVFVDALPADGARRHYRARWTRDGFDPGPWTDWVSALPVRLPRIPRERARSLFDIDLVVKPNFVVDVVVDATAVARSVKLAYTVDDTQPFPAIGTGQAFNLDAGGEALIEDITNDATYPDAEVPPSAEEIFRGTIKLRATFYDRENGEGNVLKSLRAVESLDLSPTLSAGLFLRGDTVWMSYYGNAYLSAIRWAASTSALPVAADVDPGAGTIQVGQESEGFALSPTILPEETLYVRARGYTSELAENSDLQSEEDFIGSIERPKGTSAPTLRLNVSTSGNTGTASATIVDPNSQVTAVAFKTHETPGDFDFSTDPDVDPAWTVDNVFPFDLVETVQLQEKHNSLIGCAVKYTPVGGGTAEWGILQVATFDRDEIPEVKANVSIKDDGTPILDHQGDDDTASIRYAFAEGSAPSRATALSGTIVNGRAASTELTAITLTSESVGYFTIIGFSEVDGAGKAGPEIVVTTGERLALLDLAPNLFWGSGSAIGKDHRFKLSIGTRKQSIAGVRIEYTHPIAGAVTAYVGQSISGIVYRDPDGFDLGEFSPFTIELTPWSSGDASGSATGSTFLLNVDEGPASAAEILVSSTFDNSTGTLALPASHDGGSGTSFTPNMDDGPVQRVTASGAFTLNAPTNLADGQSMTVRIIANGNDVTLSGYSGPETSFAAPSQVVVSIWNDGGTIMGMASGW